MDRRAEAWAASGAMALTGRANGPALGAPAALIDLVEQATAMIYSRTAGLVQVDGLALLGERAALARFGRQGQLSCGGGARLLRAVDGWVAVSLPRPDDVAAVPAWLESEIWGSDPWPSIESLVGQRRADELDRRAALLALPVAAVASVAPPPRAAFGLPLVAEEYGSGPSRVPGPEVIVLDLSALWAGPLCGQLLAQAGARVIKVESTTRPDGARLGPPQFFDLLNAQKESVALDLQTERGRDDLQALLAQADVVIESNRPRALEQMGLMAGDLLQRRPGPSVWVSITSHGRARGERVGFGDVAAAAGGLVATDTDTGGMCFLADAVMDPVAGLVAAAAVLEALAKGGRWLLDAGMAPMAASVAGELIDVGALTARPPRARTNVDPARTMGVDTDALLAELAS